MTSKKLWFLSVLVFMVSVNVFSQSLVPPPDLPDTFYATGLAFNQASTPNIQGWVCYGHQLSKTVYLLNTYDLTSVESTTTGTGKLQIPQIQAQARLGAAFHLRNFGSRVMLFGLGDAGIAARGSTVGSSFSGGGLILIDLGKGWGVTVPIRVIKNSQSGSQYVPEVGIVYGGK